ncbi:hypothetical protein LTR05_004904 [Lithohypha guttulata]|uniref:Major facilitator superfamily (MFS) profile domain-containing protein n=1 Tax=Lithohypha guttulata TaxID=1690604 RepID=A0AAN7SZG1_9EURO|nr:hypothetical protein LTR05_004904 [Lithohypha guttulata]
MAPSDWTDAAEWSNSRKWTVIVTACTVTFLVGINSTALLPASEDIAHRFDVDLTAFDHTAFLVTAWNAGAAVVPLFILPAMEDFGVRPTYLTLYALFLVFVMVQGVAMNFATLLVARVIAGSCGGVLQNAVDGMAADLWGNDTRRRSLSLTLFIFGLLGGVTIGAVIGGVILASLSWRWISYIQLVIYGAFFPVVIFCLHETRPRVSKGKVPVKNRISSALNETILRSSKMLLTEFVVSSFTLWSSFSFGTVLIMTQSIPLVYTALYSWSPSKGGIVQVALFIGEAIGLILCVFQDLVIFPQYSERRSKDLEIHPDNEKSPSLRQEIDNNKAGKLPPNPEARLYTSIPASLLGLTAGFFIYGWTSQPDQGYAWPLPTLGLLLIGVGIMAIVQAVTNYVTDCYPTHANSAVSAIAFGENTFAAFLPLATRDMYTVLGFAWASSLLGFLAIAVSIGPILLVVYGPRIRRRSTMIG